MITSVLPTILDPTGCDPPVMMSAVLEFQRISLSPLPRQKRMDSKTYSPRFSAEEPAKTLRPSANVTFFAFAKLEWSLAG